MNEPFTIDEVKEVSVEILMSQVFPENQTLLKDSGLWLIYVGDAEDDDVAYEQRVDESFKDFLSRSIHDMICKDEPDEYGNLTIGIDFISATIIQREGMNFRCGQGDNRCNCSKPGQCGYLEFNREIKARFDSVAYNICYTQC